MDIDGSGTLGPAEIEETLISLGLARTREDVEQIIDEIDENGNGELEFGEFLTMLKDMSMRSNKTNFLKERNLLYEKQTLAGAEFEELKKKKGELFPPLTQEQKTESYKEFNFAKSLRGGDGSTERDYDQKQVQSVDRRNLLDITVTDIGGESTSRNVLSDRAGYKPPPR